MTNKDLELIKRTNKLKNIEWGLAWDIAEQADTQEAKEWIISIGKSLFHKEECML